MTRPNPGYPAAPSTGRLPDVPSGPAPGEVDVEQVAVSVCGDLARTLRANAELRRLAAQLVDAAANAVLVANAYITDRATWERLCDAADKVHEHLVAAEPEVDRG